MKKIAKRLLCGILAAVLVSGTVAVTPAHAENAQEEGAAQTAMDVWVQNSADRAFASSQMPRQAEQEIKLYAAKNEYEAAQILVRSSEGLNNLSLQASMLIGENGAEIAASNIVIYREYSAEAKVGGDVEATPDGSDLYTDALLPNEPLNVQGNITQPYWVRVYVPKNQAAGVYTGSVTVTAQEGTFSVPVSVKVYDVTIPDTDEANFKMINWFSTAGTDFGVLESSISNQYDVEMYDENWWKVMESIARDLAIHRNNVIFMDAEALLMPESIMLPEGDTRTEYVTGTDRKMAAGRYLFDWSNFDRMMDLFLDAGAMQYLYLAGNSKVVKGAGDQMMVYVLEEQNGVMTRVTKPIFSDQQAGIVNLEAEEYVTTLFAALRAHMLERYPELMGSVYVSALDEPSTAAENQASNWYYSTIRTVYPETLSNEAHHRFTTGMTESTTLCPVLDIYETNQSFYQQQRADGKELWYYTCIGPQGNYLNRFIPYHLIKTRLIPWYAYQIGASGYLHWGYSYWGFKDTLDSVQTGDEWLVRPDVENYDIFTSVRNEAQLDGIEDYELLIQLTEEDKATADRIVASMIQSATLYTKDGATAMAAHKSLLDLLTGQATEPIPVVVFEDNFENGYDYAWNRDGMEGTSWSVESGCYIYHGAGTTNTGMTTLRNQTVKNGRITVTMQFGDTNGNDQTLWGGITFRKTNPTDTAFQSGYTLYLRKNGELHLLAPQPSWNDQTIGTVVPDEDGKVQLSVSMEGTLLKIYQNGSLLTEITDYSAPEGYISLVGTGADVTFSEFGLYSYDGVEESQVSADVIKDQSYKDAFSTGLSNWRIEGSTSAEGGKLVFENGGSAGLEGRVFSECEVNFTFNLDGTQTAADSKDHWAGMAIGKQTVYGNIWNYGGYLLLLRKNGTVDLMNNRGLVATAALAAPLSGDITARVVRSKTQIKVYLNGAEEPVLTAEAPDYQEGFLSLVCDGGTVQFDDFVVTGIRANSDSVLLDDFSGDLGKWLKVKEPDRIEIVDGKLKTTGVVVKQDTANGITGEGVSPDIVYNQIFQNAKIGFDVKIDDVALAENWAGAYFHSGGTNGFWESGGYLVFVTNTKRLVVYRNGELASGTLTSDPTDQSIHLDVEILNGTISVYVDYASTPLVQVEDSTFTSGYFGLCSDYANATFDDVYYQDLGEVEAPEEPEWDEDFSDDFSEESDNWKIVSEAAGTVRFKDGHLEAVGTSGADPMLVALSGRAYTSMDVSVDLTLPSAQTGWAGIAFGRPRWNDSVWGNGYFIYTRYWDDTGKGDIRLFKAKVGDVATAQVDWEQDQPMTLRLLVSGKDMSIFVGDSEEPIITYHDNDYTGGFLALCTYMGRNWFDNFSVNHVEPPTEPEDPVVWDEAFSDDFEENGDNWRVVEASHGSAEIQNGRLDVIGTNNGNPVLVALMGRAYTDMDLSVDLTLPLADTGWAGITFGRENWNDSIWSNGYFIYACHNSVSGQAEVKLFKANVGDVATAQVEHVQNEAVTLRLLVSDKDISVFIGGNEEPIFSYHDDGYQGGFLALCNYMGNNWYDNFSVNSVGTPVEPEEPVVWNEAFSDDFGENSDDWCVVEASHGNAVVQNGRIDVTGTDGGNPVLVALMGRAYTDMELSVDLTLPLADTGWAGITFGRENWNDSIWSNGYFIYACHNNASGQAEVKLFKANVGDVASTQVEHVQDEAITLRLLVSDKDISVFIEGNEEPVITYHDDGYQGGFLALCNYMGSNWFDNFSVKTVAEMYTVTFDSNGGSEVEQQTVRAGETVVRPANPTKDGFTFRGWYTADGMLYDFTAPVTKDFTLFARWIRETLPSETTPAKPTEPDKTDADSVLAFIDIPKSHWAYDAVKYVTDNGLFNGMDASHFAPDGKMTRAMLVTVLWRLEGKPAASAGNNFADVSDGQWYAEAVSWAAAEGVVCGVDATHFAPDSQVTREQIATILWRLAGKPITSGSLSGYPDGDQVSDFAREAMVWATQVGLFRGDAQGCLNPCSSATRAEVAALIQRYAENLK